MWSVLSWLGLFVVWGACFVVLRRGVARWRARLNAIEIGASAPAELNALRTRMDGLESDVNAIANSQGDLEAQQRFTAQLLESRSTQPPTTE